MALVALPPEAEGKYIEYTKIYNALVTIQKDNRLNDAASATIHGSASLSTSLCEGDYYRSYENQMELWRTDALTIKNKFAAANAELQTRISRAQALRDYWNQLRQIMVDDGSDSK